MPMAGKVDVCLFDKTGTLTTDELVAVGVEPPTPARPLPPSAGGKAGEGGGADRSANAVTDTLATMLEAPAAATLVLGGCQSLVLMDGSEAGDPVEAAAMKAIKVRGGIRRSARCGGVVLCVCCAACSFVRW